MPKHKVDFRYTTIAAIRDEGINKTILDDKKANRLIRFFSNRINRWTTQWFYPVKEDIRIDGRDNLAVWRPDLLPILEVDELNVNVIGATTFQGTNIPAVDFELIIPAAWDSPPRVISLRVSNRFFRFAGFVRFSNSTRVLRFPVLGKFPKGPRNVQVVGSFGWMVQKDKVSTTSTQDLASSQKTLNITSALNFDVGDVVRVGDDDPFAYFLISSISGNELTFDELDRLPATVSSGAAVVTYGSVPEAIEQACKRLVIEQRFAIGSSELREARDADSLTGEKIGDYSYTKFAPKYKNASTTGSREVDLILQDYVAPNVPRMTE